MTKQIDADVNQFPSLTWHRLHINHGHVSGGIGAAVEPQVSVVGAEGGTEQDAEAVLPEGVARVHRASGQEHCHGDATATQLGARMDALLDEAVAAAGAGVDEFTVAAGAAAAAPMRLTYAVPDASASPAVAELDGAEEAPSAGYVADTVIVAGEGSDSTFIFDFRSAADAAAVLFAHRVRVYAAPRSRVHIVTVNLLGAGAAFCNGIGTRAEDGARVEVTQLELGGRETYSGCRHLLAGHRAAAVTRSAYIAAASHTVDVNYIARHEGRETVSEGAFGGSVLDSAKKTWRGTIEFPRGCTGAAGDEQESVLLLSRDAVNKSMPVILCDEEAVEGHHGASIGRIGPDVLLYLQSRGIDAAAARAMMIRSKVNAVARFVPDSSLAADIQTYLEGAF